MRPIIKSASIVITLVTICFITVIVVVILVLTRITWCRNVFCGRLSADIFGFRILTMG